MSDSEAALALRRAFSLFPTGVVAVCGQAQGSEPVGMSVNSFSSVSLDPPLVSVCIDRNSTTWPRLDSLPGIGLSVLAADQEQLSRQLSRRTGNRFENVTLEAGEDSSRFIPGATLWLDCRIYDRLSGGDHLIILFEVMKTIVFPDIAPLVFHQSQYLGLSQAS